MNKKALAKLMYGTIMGILLIVVAFVPTLYFVLAQRDGAAIWEDYYAKEIARIINTGNINDEITLDITQATHIAKSNKINSLNETIEFDNINNEVCVKLSTGRKTCYAHIHDVDIINKEIKLGVLDANENPTNLLVFTIKEKQKPSNENK